VYEGAAGNIPVLTASDGDGDSIVMSLSGFPTGVSLSGGNIVVATSMAPGVYTGDLIASDGITTSRLSITITVLAATPSAPTGLALNTPAVTNNARPTLSWSAVGGATSYSVRINGGAWVDVGNITSYQLPTQGDGAKTLQVQANRLSGSTTFTSSASTSVGVTIDTVAPTLSSVVLADWQGANGIIGSTTFTMSKTIASVNSVSMVFA
jgi:large repetitive protein